MLKKVLLILPLLMVGAICEDQIQFVYEITRHGARSPDNSTGYKVGPNILTA